MRPLLGLVVCGLIFGSTCGFAQAQISSASDRERARQNSETFSRMSPAERRQVEIASHDMAKVLAAAQAERNALALEIAGLNPLELLSPDFRKRDADGALTRTRLAQARALVSRGQREQIQQDQALSRVIAESAMAPHLKAYYRTSQDRLVGEMQAPRKRQWAIQLDIFDTIERCVRLLANAEWENQGGQYAFASEQDLQVFQQETQRLNDLIKEGVALEAWVLRRIQDLTS